MTKTPLACALASALLALGCATEPAPVDAAVADSAVIDSQVRPPRDPIDAGGPTVFAPCRNDDDCGGMFCNLDYPRGICAPSCATDADCPEYGACLDHYCRPRCEPGANQCRDDMFCDPDDAVCEASCSARPDADAQRCPTIGDECRASYCARAETFVAGAIGAPCMAARDCTNIGCVPALNGWPGGMCGQIMRAPGLASWLTEGPVPSGGCLDAYAVVPLAGAEGDIAACVPRCLVDGDCRDGYRCDHRVVFEGIEHTDGACVPWSCGSPFDRPCGPDRACVSFSGVQSACFRSGL
jgi:hypothetical protein